MVFLVGSKAARVRPSGQSPLSLFHCSLLLDQYTCSADGSCALQPVE